MDAELLNHGATFKSSFIGEGSFAGAWVNVSEGNLTEWQCLGHGKPEGKMVSLDYCREMPKVELHVHLEGSIRPASVLKLANRNKIDLPADTEEGLLNWYRFTNFPHFVQVYVAVSRCIRTPEDLELISREFLEGQAEQHILHTEATYTAATIQNQSGIPWDEQRDALQRAIAYGRRELGVSMLLILDIVRGVSPERGLEIATWAVDAGRDTVCALGVSGEEECCSLSIYSDSFEYARSHGLPIVPHAGETCGPESIVDALEQTRPARIGHGVRCLESPDLVERLREAKIPLEINPTSNLCLNIFPSLGEYPLPALRQAGLYLTLNSDDPPMFGTTLSNEFYKCAKQFGWDEHDLKGYCRRAATASLLPESDKRELFAKVG